MASFSSLTRLLTPQLCQNLLNRTYYIQKGPPGKISRGYPNVTAWTNVEGQKMLDRIMPKVMQLSATRLPHRHARQNLLPENNPVSPEQKEEVNETRDMAEVPHFARYAEFTESDLEFTPSKLFVVWRVKALSGRPKFEKKIMNELKLDAPNHRMVVLKNTPDVNWKLWQVKHLIRMQPLTFPEGVPEEGQFQGLLLKRDGELVDYKILRENYNRRRGRPELEKYVLLRAEKEDGMRKKYFHGTLDGTLLNTLETPWSGVEGEFAG